MATALRILFALLCPKASHFLVKNLGDSAVYPRKSPVRIINVNPLVKIQSLLQSIKHAVVSKTLIVLALQPWVATWPVKVEAVLLVKGYALLLIRTLSNLLVSKVFFVWSQHGLVVIKAFVPYTCTNKNSFKPTGTSLPLFRRIFAL